MARELLKKKTSGCCIVRACHACVFNVSRFFLLLLSCCFSMEADNMHDDVSTYFGSFIGEENRYL